MALVDQSAVLAAANQLEGVRDGINATLQRYLQSCYDAQGPGAWQGPAQTTSVVTAEEIHRAQMNVSAKMGMATDTLRGNIGSFGDVDTQNVSDIQAVASGLRHV